MVFEIHIPGLPLDTNRMVPPTDRRVGTIAVLLVVLAVLFVWAGTIEADPADGNYPGSTALVEDIDAYVGAQVSVSGTVVDTEPLTIEDEPAPEERITLVVENADIDVSIGDTAWIHGTLQRTATDNTNTNYAVDAIQTVDREPWEEQYMYVVSFLGGLLVLGRLVNGWAIDRTTWNIVPRTTTLLERIT